MYEWRLEQESSLRQFKGRGMTDEEVRDFVDGCMSSSPWTACADMLADYPSYELYTESLRRGVQTKEHPMESGNHLRVVINRHRKVSFTTLI